MHQITKKNGIYTINHNHLHHNQVRGSNYDIHTSNNHINIDKSGIQTFIYDSHKTQHQYARDYIKVELLTSFLVAFDWEYLETF